MTKRKMEKATEAIGTLGINEPNSKARRLKRWIGWSLLILLIVFAAIEWSNGERKDPTEYKTQQAQRGNLTVLVTATGNLEPTNEVEVGSELSGMIESVEVDYNDRVKVGQVLARLDPSKLKAQVLQSKAALESARASVLQAQATIEEARSELARLQQLRQLSSNKAVSQHDFDVAKAELKRALADEASAKAAVSKALATLDYDEANLAKAVIHSPVDGVVLKRSVEPGQTVAATMEAPVLFTLAEDLSKMELHVHVDEADVGQVREGQQATFTVDAYPDLAFPAQIVQVRYAYQEENGVITYETVLNVDNKDLSLRPGMTGTADIVVKQIENALLAPNAALRFAPAKQTEASGQEGGGILGSLLPHPPAPSAKAGENRAPSGTKQQHVWTLQAGQLKSIAVTVGETDGSMTVVTGGEIEPGTLLVVDSVSRAQ